MLYIFQVDTGQMLCFEMDIAISTVHNLKSTISSTHGIPMDKQVLLVSGGEILEANSRVCNYAAGTDTNPIFLFNKLNIEGGGGLQGIYNDINTTTTTASLESVANNVQMADQETINKQIEQASGLPPTYMSVVTRAQLAQHIYEMGKEITRKCEVLIHHQHLQHQGWAAVVANLDDIVQLFNSKLHAFVGSYESFTTEYSKQKVDSFVNNLDSTLKTLDSIVIPQLTPHSSSDKQPPQQQQQQSIVQWLSQHYTPTNSLLSSSTCSLNSTPLHTYVNSIAVTTRKTYDHVTSDNFLQNLHQEATQVAEKASSPNMKEINGLEARLYGLDQLLQEAKHLVVDQHELTQAFHQNVTRASEQRDSSIFPDLCASHQHQLVVMQRNHGQLEDIRRRCGRAKEELTSNLNTRLKWIAFVQKNLSEMGGKIGVFHESIKRLRVNVNVLQQIHQCESTYNQYIREVQLRAKIGSRLGSLVLGIEEFNSIVEHENRRREAFRATYGSHFLSQAFSMVVEDKAIQLVPVPQLVHYPEIPGGSEGITLPQDAEKLTMSNKIKELEQLASSLRDKVDHLESQVQEKNAKLTSSSKCSNELLQKQEVLNSTLELERTKNDKLEHQVTDLKHLIDEFRIKEDENIKLHSEEVAQFHRKLAQEKQKCEERVIELTRMLEFECAQKIKGVEDHHKMEFDAMVKRFKMVNRSVGFGGSSEKIQQHHQMLLHHHNNTSDDDEDDSETGAMIMSGNNDENNCGSLERAVDAAAVLDGIGGAAAGASSEQQGIGCVSDFVVTTATRLNRLSRISISTCRVGGEANLFYFNDKFNAFTVYLSNKNVHFLNSSSNSSEEDQDVMIKNLKTGQMFIANVTDKEFCVARRAQNRYNVPQGFHFYRVKCKVVEVIDE